MDFSTHFMASCPGCQKPVSFVNPHTQLLVCTQCGSVLARTSEQTVSARPLGTVLKKQSGIQPGTRGQWEGKRFTVLGCCRCWFEESVFNYWTIAWEDKSVGWLAESYGLYYIMEPVKPENYLNIGTLQRSSPGSLKELLPGNEFILDKKQVTLSWEAEGELFMPFHPSRFIVFDYSSPSGEQMTILVFSDEDLQSFKVYPADLDHLYLEDLRVTEPVSKTFPCKQCSQPVTLVTFPLAQSCACANCGTPFSFQNGADFKKEGTSLPVGSMALAIGTEGRLNGVNYKIVGYAAKEEKNQHHSQWREYTLFNEKQGFAFLSEYDGHWIFLREAAESPVILNVNEKKIIYEKRMYELFNSYTYKVVEAKGEFPYNLFDNEKTTCKEYISPPYIWIQERDKLEGIRWFKGEHLSPRALRGAFPEAILNYRTGVGAVQPGSIKRKQLYFAVVIGLLAVLFTHFLTSAGNKSEQLFFSNYTFPDSANTISAVTGKYVFDKRKSNLKLVIYSNVSNSWFELGATLVNANTGKEYNLEKGVEYYHGVSDGESWSEGSTTENAYFTRIPAGTYFLQLQGTREAGYSGVRDFTVEGIYDVTSNRNLWLSLLLFFIWPVAIYLYSMYQESERWRNSPYSNYHEAD